MQLLLFSFFFAAFHPFHLSKTNMEYKGQTLQISTHIFIDDLEKALGERGYTKLFVGTSKENPKTDSLIGAYIQEKMKVSINQKKVALRWVGKERSKDMQAVWVYLESDKVGSLKQISVKNDLLMEIYNDQQNIIAISVVNPKKSKPQENYFVLTKSQNQASAQF